MTQSTVQTCPVCGVTIENKEKVLFSSGAAGTRARLWARVCNYAKQPACINQDQAIIALVNENDYYKPI